MPLNVGQLFVKLGLVSDDFVKGMQKSSARLTAFGDKIDRVGRSMTTSITLPLAAGGIAALKFAGDLEQIEIAFSGMLGSGEKATALIKDLQEFSARTPFQFDQLVRSTRLLTAFGFEAEKLLPTMEILGDAVAGLGGGGQEIDRITRALGQMQAKGKVAAQEMLQLSEIGINAWQILADAAGKSVADIQKDSEQGLLKASDSIEAILAGLADKFGGQMAAQAETLNGVFSTMKDNIVITMTELGDLMIPIFKPVLKDITQLFKDLKDSIQSSTEADIMQLLKLAAVLAATGPIMVGLGLIIAHPLIAGGALVLGGIAAMGVTFGDVREAIFRTWNALKAMGALIASVARLIATVFTTAYKGLKAIVVGTWDVLVNFNKALEELGNDFLVFLGPIGDAVRKFNELKKAASGFVGSGVAKEIRNIKKEFDDIDDGPGFGDIVKDLLFGLLPVLGPVSTGMRQLAAASKDVSEALENVKEQGLEVGRALVTSSIDSADAIDKQTGKTLAQILAEEKLIAANEQMIATMAEINAMFIVGIPLVTAEALSMQLLTDNSKKMNAELVASMQNVANFQRGFRQLSKVAGNAVADIALNFENMGSIVEDVLRGLVRQLIAAIAKVFIFRALASFIPGIGITGTFAEALGAGVASAFKFAEGGLVSGPTLGMVGEGPNISGSNPEVIAPLSDLKGMIGGGGGVSVNTLVIELPGERIVEYTAQELADMMQRRGINR